MSKKILFLIPYPLHQAPSQRFRFEQYADILRANNFHFSAQSFLGSQNWRVFFQEGNVFLKLIVLLKGFLKRFFVLFRVPFYDFVFIHREAAPLGPPLLEWIIVKVLRRKLIYDFDDTIWMTDRPTETVFFKRFKWRNKVKHICKWSYRISCGNDYLCAFARQFNHQVVLNPTTVDPNEQHNPALYSLKKNNDKVIIGWTGTHSTLKYLYSIEPVLKILEQEFPSLEIRIIADKKPELDLRSLTFLHWSAATEIDDILTFDIGIMPLPDDEWSKGKCGFKIIQYLSLQIPAVASPVGVNNLLIQPGHTGYLCADSSAWYQSLRKLILEKNLREMFGKNGRAFIHTYYSKGSNASLFLSLFE